MSFIRTRTRKIDWSKFFTAMVACDPYGIAYMSPEALEAIHGPASDASQSRA